MSDSDLPNLPCGYEPHELPSDYTGSLFIEAQMRAYARAAIERSRAVLFTEDPDHGD